MAKTGLKLCLAASGGGHVRQLLDLEPVWSSYDHVFVTEDTALGRSLAEKHPTRFVEHYALGQARLGRTGAMLKGAIRNLVQSVRIVRAERPDVVITTGAGAVYWTALAARLLVVAAIFQLFDGAQVIGSGALRGLSDVRVPAAITFVAYWLLAIPAGYGLGLHTSLGAVGIWAGLAAGLAVAAVLLAWRFLRLTAPR